MESNPWNVDNIVAFYCLKCPECPFYTKEETSFQNHALDDHPLSQILFGKCKAHCDIPDLPINEEENSSEGSFRSEEISNHGSLFI